MLEWLETNGHGAFAMGTVSGANTRRYHGLLVAAPGPGAARHVTLAKVDEVLDHGGGEAALGSNQYPGCVQPEGHHHLVGFRCAPFPVWTYEVGALRLEKQVFLVQGEATVVLLYRASGACSLRVQPFVAMRDYHGLRSAAGPPPLLSEETHDGLRTLSVRSPGLPPLRLESSAVGLSIDGDWYYQTEYLRELDRGLDFREDLYRAGALRLDLDAGAVGWIVASMGAAGPYDEDRVLALEQAERRRRRAQTADPLLGRLEAAADQFLAQRHDGRPTVIAGYPWFTDWGRDTMIALPGLLIARPGETSVPAAGASRLEAARAIMSGFLRHLDQGLIPNRFPDSGTTPEYNTADATLWLFQAAHAYFEAGGDPTFLHELFPRAVEILACHARGTHHGIVADLSDGLLIAGGPGSQLTWMDAKVDELVATPRHGKPVEINALWYNALRLVAGWARRLAENSLAESYEREARRVAASFEAFWNSARGCLYDVLRPDGPDDRLRPNQIFALSLPFPLLTRERQRSVLDAVEQHLLTPVGLRTLAPGDPGYVGRYEGGPRQRDLSYHQGTVWPWLLGPYVSAYLSIHGREPRTLMHCRRLLAGLEAHLDEACLGTISEVFDGDAPHRPGGAPAQAWSVAESLRVLQQELAQR